MLRAPNTLDMGVLNSRTCWLEYAPQRCLCPFMTLVLLLATSPPLYPLQPDFPSNSHVALQLALLIRSLVCLGGGVVSPLGAAAAAPGFTAHWSLDGLALNLDVRAGLPATGQSDVMHRGLIAASAEKVHQQRSCGGATAMSDPEPEERPILR